MGDTSNSISVCVRVRPFTVREAAQLSHGSDGPLFLGDGSLAGAPAPKLSQKGLRSVIKIVDEKCLVFDPPEDNPFQKFSRSFLPQGKRVKDQTFCFDRVFDDNINQADVYEATTRGLLASVLDGYNATVFAYGATGCGKTHTISGTIQQPGIIFLTMQELFERIAESSEDKVTEVSLSYLEIYNETIRDLLLPDGASHPKQGLNLREDSNKVVSVAGLSQHRPQNVQEVMDLIVKGNEARTMSPTAANATSSRSHAVLQINVSQKDRNAGTNENFNMATLSIIDLAGSERASATKNRGERLLEGANINKSLLALGSCINALCDPRRRSHIPYRDSKLTRLLKFSLGGNCKTVMIVCVSPSSAHFDETQNTLRYANRAKNIQTKVTKNVYNVNRHVKDYLVKIDEQIKLINELKAQQKDYENVSFAKFRKQNEKREGVVREGIERIRIAYNNCVEERNERIGMMKKLRQVERRIGLISTWVDAFDSICANQDVDNDRALNNLSAIRKTAQGMLLELENSRHHFHQRLAKSNWARSVDTALQTGIRQVQETDGNDDGSEADNLRREAELVKSTGEREALVAVAEQERTADSLAVSILLKAQFETMRSVESLMTMDEESALRSARSILGEIINSCTTVTSHMIKPDINIAPVDFASSLVSSPKRRKSAVMPVKTQRVSLLATPQDHTVNAEPTLRSSPRRMTIGNGAAKKGVQFTPVRRSPRKSVKKSLRWRDETGEGSMLVDYSRTPQKIEASPDRSSPGPKSSLPDLHPNALARALGTSILEDADADSSPLQAPVTMHLDLDDEDFPQAPSLAATSARFKSGFLAKKPTINNSTLQVSPSNTSNTLASSDIDASPALNDISPAQAGNRNASNKRLSGSRIPRSPPQATLFNRNSGAADLSMLSSDSGSSSDRENQAPSIGRTRSATTNDSSLASDEVRQVKSVLKNKRASSVYPGQTLAGIGTTSSATRSTRQRSPSGASVSFTAGGTPSSRDTNGSGTNIASTTPGLFSASHARRMVRGSEASARTHSILSPHNKDVAIGKTRRGTLGGTREFSNGESSMRSTASGGRNSRASSGSTRNLRL